MCKRFAIWALFLALLMGSGVLSLLPSASAAPPDDAAAVGDEHATDGHAHDASDVDAAGGHAAGDHADEGHESGPPLSPQGDLALWSGVTFILFLLVLRVFAWGPLVSGLDRRESRVRQHLADAEAARIKAEQLLADHQGKLEAVQQEVREIIAEARRDAEHTKTEIISAAQTEAEAAKNRALTTIRRATDQALKEIFDQMTQNVTDATEHVLGRALTEGDQERLVDEALAQFSGPPR